jgi:hypothetical protein
MRRQPYFYIVIYGVDGHDYLISGGESEQEAREKAIKLLKGSPYEIKSYNTTDIDEANRQFKHDRLMKSGDIRYAVKPVRHSIPE